MVLLATPAYCQTSACGPILDLLIEEAGGRDDLIVIHAEVYKNPKGVADLAQADAGAAARHLRDGLGAEPVRHRRVEHDRRPRRHRGRPGEMAEMLALAV